MFHRIGLMQFAKIQNIKLLGELEINKIAQINNTK